MGRFIDMTGWVMSEHGVSDSRLTVVERAEDGILPSGKHITSMNVNDWIAKIKKILTYYNYKELDKNV